MRTFKALLPDQLIRWDSQRKLLKRLAQHAIFGRFAWLWPAAGHVPHIWVWDVRAIVPQDRDKLPADQQNQFCTDEVVCSHEGRLGLFPARRIR